MITLHYLQLSKGKLVFMSGTNVPYLFPSAIPLTSWLQIKSMTPYWIGANTHFIDCNGFARFPLFARFLLF